MALATPPPLPPLSPPAAEVARERAWICDRGTELKAASVDCCNARNSARLLLKAGSLGRRRQEELTRARIAAIPRSIAAQPPKYASRGQRLVFCILCWHQLACIADERNPCPGSSAATISISMAIAAALKVPVEVALALCQTQPQVRAVAACPDKLWIRSSARNCSCNLRDRRSNAQEVQALPPRRHRRSWRQPRIFAAPTCQVHTLLECTKAGEQLQQLVDLRAVHASCGDLAPLQAFCSQALEQRNSGAGYAVCCCERDARVASRSCMHVLVQQAGAVKHDGVARPPQLVSSKA